MDAMCLFILLLPKYPNPALLPTPTKPTASGIPSPLLSSLTLSLLSPTVPFNFIIVEQLVVVMETPTLNLPAPTHIISGFDFIVASFVFFSPSFSLICPASFSHVQAPKSALSSQSSITTRSTCEVHVRIQENVALPNFTVHAYSTHHRVALQMAALNVTGDLNVYTSNAHVSLTDLDVGRLNLYSKYGWVRMNRVKYGGSSSIAADYADIDALFAMVCSIYPLLCIRLFVP
jgi:hypothetical protein